MLKVTKDTGRLPSKVLEAILASLNGRVAR